MGRAALLACVGGVSLMLVLFGGYAQFVQQRMRTPLLLAAIVLLVFAIHQVFSGLRPGAADGNDDHDHHGHEHDHHGHAHGPLLGRVMFRGFGNIAKSYGPRVGWLLLLPVAVLIAVAPSALGAAASGRLRPVIPEDRTESYAVLETSDGPAAMTIYEFLDRAIWDEERSLEGVPVRLEGIVVNDPRINDGFLLTRFIVSCCAADGVPIQVHVVGAPNMADDTWVRADVVWRPPEAPYPVDSQEIVVVKATLVDLTVLPDAPRDPYESPY